MNSWLEPKAFWIAFSLTAFVQVSKIMNADIGSTDIIIAITTSVVGGVFWGAIGTYVYRRFYKKP